jgi:intein/homing endonuclease
VCDPALSVETLSLPPPSSEHSNSTPSGVNFLSITIFLARAGAEGKLLRAQMGRKKNIRKTEREHKYFRESSRVYLEFPIGSDFNFPSLRSSLLECVRAEKKRRRKRAKEARISEIFLQLGIFLSLVGSHLPLRFASISLGKKRRTTTGDEENFFSSRR